MLKCIENVTTVVAGVLLFLTCLLTFGDVVGRNILNRPLPGATELTELALVGMTFLIYPQIAFRQQHITIDLFDFLMGTTARRLQQCLSGIIGMLVFAGIGQRLWVLAGRSVQYGDVTAYLRIPIAPAYYFMSALSCLTAAAFAIIAVSAFLVSAEELHRTGEKTPSGLE